MIKIAIDGYSSTGKSTMAKKLASEIGYRYIDSGAMYRALTLYALQNEIINDGSINEQRLIDCIDKINIDFKNVAQQPATQHTFLNGKDVEAEIRTMEVSNFVSKIATFPYVRAALVRLQQNLGRNGGIVMDGRDIGTTVFPDAELKIFVTASAETRARRRYNELVEKGDNVDYRDVLDNIRERDYLDETRATSPLRKADDALLLDNSEMTIAEQDNWLLKQYRLHAKS